MRISTSRSMYFLRTPEPALSRQQGHFRIGQAHFIHRATRDIEEELLILERNPDRTTEPSTSIQTKQQSFAAENTLCTPDFGPGKPKQGHRNASHVPVSGSRRADSRPRPQPADTSTREEPVWCGETSACEDARSITRPWAQTRSERALNES